MARMHSRKKGKAKSHKPKDSAAKSWVRLDEAKVKEAVEKLFKEGKNPAEIGLILRDQHGVPSVKAVLGKSLSTLLKELKLQRDYPADLMDLIQKAVVVRKHLAKNKRDIHNRVKLGHIESKIKRLVRYYRGKKLPADWKYDPDQAALLVK
ncbi:MAG: 30S ribosomal protein S15 [Candidatus Micrarchaeota archaeon]